MFLRFAVCLFLFLVSATPASSGPPPGLTAYGRVIWNLDALLHDKFGRHTVYVNYSARTAPPRGNFSTRFVAEAASRRYIFTFANARSSAFRTTRPSRPPKAYVGAAGWSSPLTLSGAYISCGNGKWLFEHGGQGPANWELFCSR